jgi:A/G-specific adenine glycosylase
MTTFHEESTVIFKSIKKIFIVSPALHHHMKKNQSFLIAPEESDEQPKCISFSRHHLTSQDIADFQTRIHDFYDRKRRSFPWRKTTNPYHILVSEFMLQQTQTQRVMKKYGLFLSTFPDIHSLAHASLQDILSLWHGLGYNRRALFLKKTAQLIASQYETLPDDPAILSTFPGIGPATAGAIVAYAYNKPTLFVETNIRTVFLYFFFSGEKNISDTQILPLVEKTLDRDNPRTWYYALTDYGVWLKKTHKNPGRRSAHQQQQSPFKGSNREIRGAILKTFLSTDEMSLQHLMQSLPFNEDRVRENCNRLEKEGFVTIKEKSGKKRVSIST